MHYLEAIIELLEYLPEEVRKKCFELQQLDLQYQEKMEKLKVDTRELTSSMQTLPQLEYERRNKDIQQRYQEAHEIADEKVQITEYLQSVLEKYQERVMKELVDFKADLEIDNPGEVDLIEKEFIQSIMSSSSSSASQDRQGKRGERILQEQLADDSTINFNEQMPSTSALSASAPAQSTSSTDHRLNGFGQSSVEGTPKTHLPFQHRKLTGQYDDFKVPNFRRPSQSVDRISMLQRGIGIDEDIFDTEISPPSKRQKPSSNHSQRLLSIAGGLISTSRDNSPRPGGSHSSSHSPNSSLTSSPAIGHPPFTRFPFHPRISAMATAESSTSNQQFPKSMPSSSSMNDQPSSSTSRPTMTIRMPSFAEPQSSHGRHRKLTKKVEQMLSESRMQGGQQNRPPPTSAQVIYRRRKRKLHQQTENEEEQQLEEIDEEDEEEDEEEEMEDYDEEEEEAIVEGDEEEEADDRAWCYCKQGSAGNMVACDNSECPYVWFHYECVGIQQAPKGRWFCPTCSMKMNAIAQQQRSRSTSIDHK